MKLVVWQNSRVVEDELLASLASEFELRLYDHHPRTEEINADEVFVGCYQSPKEVMKYKEEILSLSERAIGAVVVLPQPWELGEEWWTYSWQHRIYLAAPVPVSRFSCVIRYAGGLFRMARQGEFLSKLFFMTLLMRIHSEGADWIQTFRNILSVLVTETRAEKGLLLSWEGTSMKLLAAEGFPARDDMIQGFMNSVYGKDVLSASEECRRRYEELLKSLGYNFRREDIHVILLRARGKDIGLLCLYGSINDVDLDAVERACDYLALLVYSGQMEGKDKDLGRTRACHRGARNIEARDN